MDKKDRELIKPLATEEFVEKCMADLKAMGMNEDGEMEENEEAKAVKVKYIIRLELDGKHYKAFHKLLHHLAVRDLQGIGMTEAENEAVQLIIKSING